MKIENITTEVRPRTSWESIDLGFRMVQTWFKSILFSWLLVVLPVWIIIYSILYQYPILVVVIIWWLKPVFDRIPLHIVSHSVFGDILSVRDVRKALPSLIKPHLFKSLIWYRFDPVRSFNLPVWQLEGLKGMPRMSRARILQKNTYSTAMALTFFSLFIQTLLWASCYALLYMLLPTNVSSNDVSLFEFHEGSLIPGLILNLFAFISLTIIEPFYVVGGFALYLNRRTHLEAWDIELKFRSLAQRMSSSKKTMTDIAKVSSIVVAVLCFVFNSDFTVISTAQAKANDVHYTEISNKQANDIITEMMNSDEFNTKIKTKGWHIKDGLFGDLFKDLKNKDKTDKENINFFGEFLSVIVANIFYVLLGLAVFVILLYLGFKLFKYLPRGLFTFNASKNKEPTVAALFGLDLAPESLPDDVGKHAWALWQQEKFTQALSLLYRGSLSKLVNRDGVKLPVSATEGDCIKILRNSHIKENTELVNYFVALTLMWQRAAYAHRLPELNDIKKTCETWSVVFLQNSVAQN